MSERARDKRIFPRRCTRPLDVTLTGEDHEPISGQVLDYAPTGLSVRVDQEVPLGSLWTVRPLKAPKDHTGFPVRVKNCQPEGKKWRLGCQFLKRQHWDDLWIFGGEAK